MQRDAVSREEPAIRSSAPDDMITEASGATDSSSLSPEREQDSSNAVLSSLSSIRAGRARKWGSRSVEEPACASEIGAKANKRIRLLTLKEETLLATRLQRYFKLKDRHDKLQDHLERDVSMEEFAQHLGTSNVDRVSSIMTSGPDAKAAFVKHNMGLVVSVCRKYANAEVSGQVCSQLGSFVITERSLPSELPFA
jgi:DNA-directed RNA polymerase sigma subunit (sigma70/sigma32)